MVSASKRVLLAAFAAATIFAPPVRAASPAPAAVALQPQCPPGYRLELVCGNGYCHYVCVADGT